MYCSRADSWLQDTQPEPPLWRYMPSSLRSVLFLVLTRILCSKDFNFFCLLQATAGGMSRAFFSSDEACSHGCGKEDGGRGSGRQEQAEERDMQRHPTFSRKIWAKTLKGSLKQLFESQEATSSAIGLQSAAGLLWPVPETQLRSYLSNIPKLTCPNQSKETR